MRETNNQVAEKNTQLDAFLAAMQLDQLHLQDHDYLKLPKNLLECCAGVNTRQTSLVKTEIPTLMKSIVGASTQAKSMLDDVQDMLEEEHHGSKSDDDSLSSDESEESSDEDDRRKYKKSPVSERKKRLRELVRRYERLFKSYTDANQSNAQLRDAFEVVIKDLQFLALPLKLEDFLNLF